MIKKRKGYFKNSCDRHGLLFGTDECPTCQFDDYISMVKKDAYDDGFNLGFKYGRDSQLRKPRIDSRE